MAPSGFEIDGRRIGPGEPPYVVAEMSANHGGDFQRAVKIVEAAADAGADAVKLQTYSPEGLTLDCDRPCFRIEGTIWSGQTLHELYRAASTPWQWQPELKRIAGDLGLQLFCSAFDFEAVDFLEQMGVPAYKIASFELVDLPLLGRVAATGKPIILSTGMATLAEIDEAVRTVYAAGGSQLALLKCTSAYPAEPEEMNLRAIPHLADRFGLPVGLSDHTLDAAVPVAAVALGASVLEKHLTLCRADGGPDGPFSMEPHELRQMVRAVRSAHRALGEVRYGLSESEKAGYRLRRSLFAAADIEAGEQFTNRNVRSIRPADGLHPRHLESILGRTARCHIERGTPLDWGHLG